MESTADLEPTDGAIVVLTRPGCMFSAALLDQLEGSGLPVETRDIWEDDEAAGHLRQITGGDETVPTVLIGEAARINPSLREVVRTAAEHAPELLPEDLKDLEAPEPGLLERLLARLGRLSCT